MAGFVAASCVGKQYVCGIFQIPGLTLDFVKPDWMHTVDLGILQYLVGCIMWELFLAVGGTWYKHTQACATLMNIIKNAC